MGNLRDVHNIVQLSDGCSWMDNGQWPNDDQKNKQIIIYYFHNRLFVRRSEWRRLS